MQLSSDINRGDRITASWLNSVKNAVMRHIVGGRDINVNRGALVSISAETRVTIDAPEACT